MADLLYQDELKEKLKSYGQVIEQIDKLTSMKEQIRTQLKQWMGINNLTEHCIYDENNQCWKIGFNTSARRSIVDWNELRAILGDDYSEHVQLKDSVAFKVTKVKKPT